MPRALLLLLIFAPWNLAAAAARPGVLFIIVDDLNDYIGCLSGHPNAKTPNIDRLAARGTLFTNAHCQAPSCAASRASMMTGLLPSTSGIYSQIADADIRSANRASAKASLLPDYLEAHGYRTFGCGKIYHGGDGAGSFDEFGPGPPPTRQPRQDSGSQVDWGPLPKTAAGHPDQGTADWARRRILLLSAEVATERKPFFLAAGFVSPRPPWRAPQPWFDQQPLKTIKPPVYKTTTPDDLPTISKRVNAPATPLTIDWVTENGHWTAILQAYLACTTAADHQVGRVLQMLDASPLAENTYIILCSDNGYHLGEKGRFGASSLWRHSSRVPLIIVGPGLPKGQTCPAPVQLLDIYPTLVELLDLTPNRQNEGHSLVPLLKSPKAEWPHFAITTHGRNNHAIQARHHRYIQYEDGTAELYDHRTDPTEQENIAATTGQEKRIGKLRRGLPRTNAKKSATAR